MLPSADPDAVFKALADAHRRRILDLLRASPGQSVSGLAASFPFTRFGLRKHLLVLQEADLVRFVRCGREKRLYLNPVPLRLALDRWLRPFDAVWSDLLVSLRHASQNTAQHSPPPVHPAP